MTEALTGKGGGGKKTLEKSAQRVNLLFNHCTSPSKIQGKIFLSRFVKLLLEVQRCTKVDPPDRVKKEASRGRSAAPRMEEKRE